MANTKQNFLGLVKINGMQSEAYRELDKTGKLVFAHLWDSESEGVKVNERFIINANGVEYKIATEDIFKSLEARVATLEATLEAWKLDVDSSIDELQAKDIEIDSSISDISSRLSESLKSAEIASAIVADNSTLITLTTTDNAGTTANTSVKVSGSNYVKVEGTANNVTLSVATASVATAGEGEGLADAKDVKDYVDDVLQELEQALIFKGAASSDASLPDDASAGWTYVADASWESTEAGKHIESGDLLIRGENSWVVVERNLDGAVTAGTALDSSHLVVGTGNQGVKTIDVTAEDLATAIANANLALRNVQASATQNAYVTIDVATNGTDPSTKDVSAILTVVDTSAALNSITTTGSLVDANAVKEFVEGKIAEIPEVEMTLDSSTPEYVTTSATVSGGAITAEVSVTTATLADGSNGIDGLATAVDVYTELSKVEEVIATSVTTMADTLGLDSSLNVTWSTQSGIDPTATYKEAIEGAYEEAHKSGVTSFGGATGAISIATASDATHNVVFNMNSSTLEANVDLSNIDASINALQAKDVEIDASIDRLDASVTALENRTITGESEVLTNANDAYVNVAATTDAQGNVALDSSVQLATDVTLPAGETHATPTGLATDGWVKDFLAWEVIGD